MILSVIGLALYLAFEYVDGKVVFWRDTDLRFEPLTSRPS